MHEEYIKEMFNECGVAKLLDIEVTELAEGVAKGRLIVREEHRNVFGGIHGGILFTFADHIGGACGNTFGRKAVLVESSIHYMRDTSGEKVIYCEARLTHRGRTIGRIDTKLYAEDGAVISLTHQIFYIMEDEHQAEAG